MNYQLHYRQRGLRLPALMIATISALSISLVHAKPPAPARGAAAVLASTRMQSPAPVAPMSGAAVGAPVCCPKPCIDYRYRGCQDVCCNKCAPKIEMVLQVTDPCTGCLTDVPVCLPGCCEGAPRVCNDRGFLGRDVMWYDWSCGFSVRVTFKKTGDLIVTYFGH
jgi:hypothetical protein